ncbi:MAG TPA: ParM/StbA family protein [Anaerolineae bacterium]|nr:ParM/StbA family protein [Anaerolineae bacterium]
MDANLVTTPTMNTDTLPQFQVVGLDEGAGAVKIYTACGATEFNSQIAHNGTDAPGAVAGLETLTPPLQITFTGGTFYTGPGAHAWGRPVENLDFGRFAGSPEMAAILYGAFTRHVETYGTLAPLRLKVGLPQQALAGEAGKEIIPGVKSWLTGAHQWAAQNGHVPPAARAAAREHLERFAATASKDDLIARAAQEGLTLARSWNKAQMVDAMLDNADLVVSFGGGTLHTDYSLEVRDVQVTSQPVGAWFDFLLDEAGSFLPARKSLYAQEIGVISIGMSTVELLVVQQGKASPRFTRGETEGVQRLLALANPRNHYSRGEMDARLRSGALNTELPTLLPMWWPDINGLINRVWESTWERFGAVIIVGGGAILLGDYLRRKFREKAVIPDSPVLAVARGLYKFGVMQARQGK